MVHIFYNYIFLCLPILHLIFIISPYVVLLLMAPYYILLSSLAYYLSRVIIAFFDSYVLWMHFFKRYYAWALMFRNTRNSPASWNLINHPGSNFTRSPVLTSFNRCPRAISQFHASVLHLHVKAFVAFVQLVVHGVDVKSQLGKLSVLVPVRCTLSFRKRGSSGTRSTDGRFASSRMPPRTPGILRVCCFGRKRMRMRKTRVGIFFRGGRKTRVTRFEQHTLWVVFFLLTWH